MSKIIWIAVAVIYFYQTFNRWLFVSVPLDDILPMAILCDGPHFVKAFLLVILTNHIFFSEWTFDESEHDKIRPSPK